jgi:hypothetical protein
MRRSYLMLGLAHALRGESAACAFTRSGLNVASSRNFLSPSNLSLTDAARHLAVRNHRAPV